MMRILVLSDYYLPGHLAGGPIRTLANMVARLGEEFTFRIITRDRDLTDCEPYSDIVPDSWQEVGRAQVLYLPPAGLSLRRLRQVICTTEHEVLYLNSFFSRSFTLKPLLLRRLGMIPPRPLVLAPRGEFSPGALRGKGFRKEAFIRAARACSLYGGVVWQASSAYEEEDIRRSFDARAPVLVAPDVPAAGAAESEGEPRREKQPGRLRVAFLSRISRKKNLDGALRMLEGLEGSVELDIYGPLEDPGYWAECRALMERLPPNVRVEYRGPVAHERVAEVMRQHDLFFFPTLGENFGHVILEALQAGTPVLISDQTPWRGLAEKGVGWELSLDQPEAFRSVLQRCVEMPAEEHRLWSQRAAHFGLRRSQDDEVLRQNRELFRYACPAASARGSQGRATSAERFAGALGAGRGE